MDLESNHMTSSLTSSINAFSVEDDKEGYVYIVVLSARTESISKFHMTCFICCWTISL